jgi:two-component system, NtrC family, nitrogen regulation response regulator NtrX
VLVFPVELPPLRERLDDLPALVEHFARQVSAQNGWKAIPFTNDAIAAFAVYKWPGNIRELRNVVERLLLLAEDAVDGEAVRLVLPSSASKERFAAGISSNSNGPLSERVLAFERAVVLAELDRCHRHITQTAKALGLERSHFYKKCQQLGIDLQSLPEREG